MEYLAWKLPSFKCRPDPHPADAPPRQRCWKRCLWPPKLRRWRLIELDGGILAKLESVRGTLAYLAIIVRGEGTWPTAHLAAAVHCQTAAMREGLEELSRLHPEAVRGRSGKWTVGSGVATFEALQILESDKARRQDLLDDLKKFSEWATGTPFIMQPADAKAVSEFLKVQKTWDRATWQTAMRHRAKSEGVNLSQPIYLWLRRLPEYLISPLDRYGKAAPNGGGKIGQAISVEQSNREARAAAVASVPVGR